MQELNEREYAVVQAYVNNGYNKTRAYKTVFPHCTDDAARVQGCKMLNKEPAQRAIAELTDQKITPIKDSKEAIIKEAVEITQEARAKQQYSAAMKGLDTRAKLGGYYDQDEESSQKYLTFINQVNNNTLINVNDKTNNELQNNKTIQEDKLEVVSLIDKSNVIDIDNPNDNDRDDQYIGQAMPEVG